MRVCLAGTFDPAFHRNRILERLLARSGVEITVCHAPLWGQREDRVVKRGKFRLCLSALRAYPLLAWRFLTSPRPDIVLVPYPGHFDVPLLAALARWRRTPLLFDAFLSIFDTVVSDRALVSPASLTARLAARVDRAACRHADSVLVDTPQSGHYFAEHSNLPASRFRVLWIGARESVFQPQPLQPVPGRILFYGTFIPLHGIETIVRAAKALESAGLSFRLIGTGQERPAIERLVSELSCRNVELLAPVPLERLPAEIAQATLCLGIFGTSGKAQRVIPNKLFECLAVGRPVLTGDTPAVRGAFGPAEVATAPPGDWAATAAAIASLVRDHPHREELAAAGHRRYLRDYSEEALSRLLRLHLEATMAGSA